MVGKLGLVFLLLLLVFNSFAFAFSQSIKQVEPAIVNQPVSWRLTLRASNLNEKSFFLPLPETAFDVLVKTKNGESVQFVLEDNKVVCVACDLSKQDYVVELKTPGPVLLERGWVKNEEASTAMKQEVYSQIETVFNPSKFNYKNVQGFLVCSKDFVCSTAGNNSSPFFKIDSLKSNQEIDFVVAAMKITSSENEEEAGITKKENGVIKKGDVEEDKKEKVIHPALLVLPLEDYVQQTRVVSEEVNDSGKNVSVKVEQAVEQLGMVGGFEGWEFEPLFSSVFEEFPKVFELNESEAVVIVNQTPDYSFGIASITGNDFLSVSTNEKAGAWSVFDSNNKTEFELDYSFFNSSNVDPQTLFFKTRFYDSLGSNLVRIEIFFDASNLCASCFAWLKMKKFDKALRELGENDVFFNSKTVFSNALNAFLLKPLSSGEENSENNSVFKVVVEFDASNSSFTRFFLGAYSLDGNYFGQLLFEQPLVVIKSEQSIETIVKITPLVIPLEKYIALNQTNSS